ncbi:hypothetical protein WICPIJ_005974 [Wickerhamomyces pijperi]|uniref:methionyl-tRNA formyltransferase n=1 Tax=Wickerhamomyces pijperi TaxID=599730 RepID=A0A9P8Q4X5_WICPI|nr:hypothetical protein WICPIJ_005974 [Wickerhamomyces pijperi]
MRIFRIPNISNSSSLKRPFSTSYVSKINDSKSLKIAFFGSDEFSIESLSKLLEVSQTHKSLISQIDVIARHPKPVNRGLKELRDLPIAQFALENNLNIIRAETKSEIIDKLTPNQYDLIVAVSYGKLIPSQLLSSVPYSLNVHPSLLPRYSGASPLQFALLNHDSITGVTVQTLHPTEFDKGDIVDQIGDIPITRDETLVSLRDKLGSKGGELLSDVIVNGSFMNPNFQSSFEYSYAKKIPKSMSEVDWDNETSFGVVRKFNTLGSLFTFKEMKIKKKKKSIIHEYRRVLLSDIREIQLSEEDQVYASLQEPGDFTIHKDESQNLMVIKTKDGFVSVGNLQLEFEPKEDANKFWQKLPKRAGDTPVTFSTKISKTSSPLPFEDSCNSSAFSAESSTTDCSNSNLDKAKAICNSSSSAAPISPFKLWFKTIANSNSSVSSAMSWESPLYLLTNLSFISS